MPLAKRLAVILAGLTLAGFAFGFVLFAGAVMREISTVPPRADGIVVLTGGETRIEAGARLLAGGLGERLLISGVNPAVKMEDVRRIAQLSDDTFACCVDLGYEALNTFGNADETRDWVMKRHYDSLIVVTSTYHMPRSLTELAIALPGVELIPYGVRPPNFPSSAWWLHYRATRVMLSEYLKFIPAAARLALTRASPWHNTDKNSIADSRGQHAGL